MTRNTDPCASKYLPTPSPFTFSDPCKIPPGRALKAPSAPSSAFSHLPPRGEGATAPWGSLSPGRHRMEKPRVQSAASRG